MTAPEIATMQPTAPPAMAATGGSEFSFLFIRLANGRADTEAERVPRAMRSEYAREEAIVICAPTVEMATKGSTRNLTTDAEAIKTVTAHLQ